LVPHIKGKTQTKGVREESVKIFQRNRKDVEDGEKCIKRSFMVCIYHHTFLGMWPVRGRTGMRARFSWGDHRDTDRSEEPGACGTIIIKHLQNMNGGHGLGTVRLGQNRDKLWALVNTAVNLKIPQIAGIS
jgi:hypothetical protein